MASMAAAHSGGIGKNRWRKAWRRDIINGRRPAWRMAASANGAAKQQQHMGSSNRSRRMLRNHAYRWRRASKAAYGGGSMARISEARRRHQRRRA